MEEKDTIITYERLYELLRLEKYHQELQPIDRTFYDHVVRYLADKKNTLQSQENKDSIFTAQSIQKTQKQLENIRKILQELYERRESKIVQLAIFSSRTNTPQRDNEAMLEEEKELYTHLISHLSTYRTALLHTLLDGKRPQIGKTKDIKKETETPNHKVVRFLAEVPQFVGEDLHTYGPYKATDVATLPIKVSEVLLKNKNAEEL